MYKLKDIFSEQITGEWGSECATNQGGTYVLRTTNFTNEGIINFDNVVKRNIADKKIKTKQLKLGDIILEKSGGSDNIPVGRVVYCDENIEKHIFLCNNFTQAMRVNTEIANPRYIFYYMYFLHKVGATSLLQSKTTGIRNLQLKSYLNQKVPLPNLDKQRKIVNVLDRVTQLIEYNRKQISLLDLLVKSRFTELFGDIVHNKKQWELMYISDLADIKIGPFGSLLHKEDYIKNGHALINPSNILDNKVCIDNELSISDNKYDELSAYKLEIGDIILARRGEMGRCAVIDSSGLLCGTGSMIIRPNDKIRPYFLQKVISSNAYKNIITKKAVGITMKNLNVSIVSNLKIPVPPIDLQDKYIALLKRTDLSKVEIQKSLDKLEMLKKSLMQQYFG